MVLQVKILISISQLNCLSCGPGEFGDCHTPYRHGVQSRQCLRWEAAMHVKASLCSAVSSAPFRCMWKEMQRMFISRYEQWPFFFLNDLSLGGCSLMGNWDTRSPLGLIYPSTAHISGWVQRLLLDCIIAMDLPTAMLCQSEVKWT